VTTVPERVYTWGSHWNKFLFALVMAVVLGVRQGLADGQFAGVDYVLTAGMLFAAANTLIQPNTPVGKFAKTWANALTIGAGVLAPLLLDGWQLDDLWVTVIAVVEAAGVWAIPNARYPIGERRLAAA
jgi:hypothetical protein